MWTYIKKILIFISLFLVLIIVKEFVALYQSLSTIHPYVGYLFLVSLLFISVYFIVIPLVQIFKLRVSPAPSTNPKDKHKIIEKRLKFFKKNVHLNSVNFEDGRSEEELYNECIDILKKYASEIRAEQVRKVFIGTAIAQNGFIDVVIILVSQIQIMRSTFLVFNSRMALREMIVIGKHVYYSLVIGGTDVIEDLGASIFKKVDVPFVGKLISSLTDGIINANFTARVSLITEAYCTETYIKSESKLYPITGAIRKTTEDLTSPIIDKIKSIISTKSIKWSTITNPIKYVVDEAVKKTYPVGNSLRNMASEITSFLSSPIRFGHDKLARKKDVD